MPSYTGAVSAEDAWHLAYYVASLHEPPHEHRIARAAHVAGALPQTVDDPAWAAAESTLVRLRNAVSADGEWVDPPTVSAVLFQVLVNEDTMVLRASWDDPSEDSADALALLLKPEAARGDVVTLQAWPYEGAPALDIVHWRANLSDALERVETNYFFEKVSPGLKPIALSSTAAYQDGRWMLVLQRPFEVLAGAAVIRPEELTSIAFAVWDGARPGARAVSPWIDLAFPHDDPKAEY